MKFHSLSIIVILILLLGCDASQEPTLIELTVGGSAIPNTAGESHFLDFQKSIESQSSDFKLKMLVHSQLGSEENLVSGLRRNRIHFANLSAIITSTPVSYTHLTLPTNREV